MRDITTKAIELMKVYYPEVEFKASNGWFWRFVKRNKLTRRTPTHIMTRLSETINKDIVKYLQSFKEFQFQNLVRNNPDSKKKILWINTDQVPTFMDMSSGKTYHRKGEKSVEIKKTAGEKARLTVMLSIACDDSEAYLLPPYVIFKSKLKNSIENKYPAHGIIRHNSAGWIQEDLMKDWIDRIIGNLKLSSDYKVVLVMDHCKVHTKDAVINHLKSKNIEHFLVPAGCTGLLQPLDVCLNKPFKDEMRNQFSEWFKSYGSIPKNQSKSGYFLPPKFPEIYEWILTSWNKMSKELVLKSFQYCGTFEIYTDLFYFKIGITVKMDGSQDKLINPKILKIEEIRAELERNLFEADDDRYQTYP
jgi:hypothetical protein